VKKLHRKTLDQDVFDKSWSLDGVKTPIKNISAVRISISLATCLKFSFKLVTFSKSYARKHKWVFFSEHSVFLW